MPTFERFELDFIEVPEATLRVRHGGTGPAVLLLQDHPRTHTTWHRVAPILSASFTVVCRICAASIVHRNPPIHRTTTARRSAPRRATVWPLMDRLGFERFAVVGHDRGCYTAFRTGHGSTRGDQSSRGSRRRSDPGGLERCDERFARTWWPVLLRTAGKTRASRSADPDAWYGGSLRRWGRELRRLPRRDPRPVGRPCMIEDYRACLGVIGLTTRRIGVGDERSSVPSCASGRSRTNSKSSTATFSASASLVSRLRGKGIDCAYHRAEEARRSLRMRSCDSFASEAHRHRPPRAIR